MTTHPSELSDEQIKRIWLEITDELTISQQAAFVMARRVEHALRQETTSAAAPAEPVAWGEPDAAGNVIDVMTALDKSRAHSGWSRSFTQPLYATPITPAAAPREQLADDYMRGVEDALNALENQVRFTLCNRYHMMPSQQKIIDQENESFETILESSLASVRKRLPEFVASNPTSSGASPSSEAETTARRTAEYWKAELVAANLEIDRLRASTATEAKSRD